MMLDFYLDQTTRFDLGNRNSVPRHRRILIRGRLASRKRPHRKTTV
jgi:hypothetical protein